VDVPPWDARERVPAGSERPLKGVSYTEARQHKVVSRAIDKVVAGISEQSNVWCKTVFETAADVAKDFVTGASPVKLPSHDWREMIAFVKYAPDDPKNVR